MFLGPCLGSEIIVGRRDSPGIASSRKLERLPWASPGWGNVTLLHCLRWFLDAAGWPRSSWLVLANGLAMTVVFFVVRIAVIPSYYARVLASYGTPEYERLGLGVQLAWIGPSLALEVLNVVWMYRITRGFYRAFCRSKAHKTA